MQGLGALPVELLIIIIDQIARKDILNFRLCAPRNILPLIDTIVFREICLPIDTSDDLERWKWEDEKEGVALQRLVDVSQSRIVKHMRVLVLRVARPYNPITAFDKRPAAQRKAPLFQHTTINGSVTAWLQRAMGSMRLVKPVKPVKPQGPHLSKRNYAAELANALRALVLAADMITTIRLTQSIGYYSHRDIVYPTVYGRALMRLFDALLGVTFAPSVGATLEIHDCPLINPRESGLFLDEVVIKKVVAKFSHISLETHHVNHTFNYQWAQLGQQLVDGLYASGDHLTGLSLRGAPYWISKRLIVSEDNYPSLTYIALFSIWISSAIFVPFISSRLPQLISLHASYIYLDEGERWQEAFDVWRAVKRSVKEQGKDLKLKHLTLVALYDRKNPVYAHGYSPWVDKSTISSFVKDILPPTNMWVKSLYASSMAYLPNHW